MKLHIEAVNGCNQSCPGCQSPKNKLHFMEPGIFAMAIDKLNPSRAAIYGLGETFLHPQIKELLSIRNLMGIDSIIKTNGTAPLTRLKSAIGLVRRIMFDIDGISQNTHGISRSSNLEQVKSNLLKTSEAADKTETRVGLYMLVHSHNWHEAIYLYDFCRINNLDFEAVPYLPIQIGTYHPQPAHTHLVMSDENRRNFINLWAMEPCLVTHYMWDIDTPHIHGAFLRWDGKLLKCLGRLLPLNQNINNESIKIPDKLCGDCPINQLICSYAHKTVSVGAQAYAIPPRIKWSSDMREHVEEYLMDCPLDPYS